MQHTNKIAILVLSREFHDYPRNDWHYDREYNLIVKALNEQEKLNKSEVISSLRQCSNCVHYRDNFDCDTCNEHLDKWQSNSR